MKFSSQTKRDKPIESRYVIFATLFLFFSRGGEGEVNFNGRPPRSLVLVVEIGIERGARDRGGLRECYATIKSPWLQP